MQTYANVNLEDKLLDLKVAPMFLDRQISLCLQINDVTKVNIIQGLVERAKSKTEMADVLIKELANPLKFLYKAIKKESGQEIIAYHELIVNKLNTLKDYTKMNNQMLRMINTHFNIVKLATKILTTSAVLAAERGVFLFLYIDNKISPDIRSDATRVKTVLINLLTSVLKQSKKSQQILLKLVYISKDQIQVTFSDIGGTVAPVRRKKKHMTITPGIFNSRNVDSLFFAMNHTIAKRLGPMHNTGIKTEKTD